MAVCTRPDHSGRPSIAAARLKTPTKGHWTVTDRREKNTGHQKEGLAALPVRQPRPTRPSLPGARTAGVGGGGNLTHEGELEGPVLEALLLAAHEQREGVCAPAERHEHRDPHIDDAQRPVPVERRGQGVGGGAGARRGAGMY